MKVVTKIKDKKDSILEVSTRHMILENHCAVESGRCCKESSGSFYTNSNKLFCITNGTVMFKHGSETYEIADNEMAFIRKDISIDYEIKPMDGSSDSVCYFIFSLEDQFVLEFVKLISLSILESEFHFPLTKKAFDARFLNYILSLDLYFEEPNMYLLKVKLFELLFHLASNDREILNQFLDFKTDLSNSFKTIIEDNIMNSISIDELCILTGRSQSSFRRDFHAIYNMPPSQWIRERRLEKAKELLLITKLTITDVCYAVGFESISHFSRLFKSYFGLAPTEFRLNKGSRNNRKCA